MSASEPTAIEIATLIMTAAVTGGQRDIVWDEIIRVAPNPRLSAEVMFCLTTIGAAVLRVSARRAGADPVEFLQSNAVRWLRERDGLEAGDDA